MLRHGAATRENQICSVVLHGTACPCFVVCMHVYLLVEHCACLHGVVMIGSGPSFSQTAQC